MANKLIILGSGGSALDVLDIVDALNTNCESWEVVGFLDDGKQIKNQHISLPVLGPLSDAQHHTRCLFINTIGSDLSYKARAVIIKNTGLENTRFVTLVHPQSSVSPRAKLGVGVCVNYGVSIGGRACIGNHVYISPCAIIGHDAIVGDYSIIAPGAIISGFVEIGASCYIGAGSIVRQRIRISERSLVGMGAVVVRDVETNATVIGNPAIIRQ